LLLFAVLGKKNWIEGLYLESFHQSFLVMGFYEIESCKLFAQASNMIFLIFASWVARITDMIHWHPATFNSQSPPPTTHTHTHTLAEVVTTQRISIVPVNWLWFGLRFMDTDSSDVMYLPKS
jgi:hypothetical protein